MPRNEAYSRNRQANFEEKQKICELKIQNQLLKEDLDLQARNYEESIKVLTTKLNDYHIKEKNEEKEKIVQELANEKRVIPKENALILTDKLHKYIKAKNKTYNSISDWVLEYRNQAKWESSISQSSKQVWKLQKVQ